MGTLRGGLLAMLFVAVVGGTSVSCGADLHKGFPNVGRHVSGSGERCGQRGVLDVWWVGSGGGVVAGLVGRGHRRTLPRGLSVSLGVAQGWLLRLRLL